MDDKIAVISSVRFPGGTAGALLQELESLVKLGCRTVHSPKTRMLESHPLHRGLVQECRRLNIDISEEFSTVSADTVIIHNPAMFKFEDKINFRIFCRRLIIINHENLLTGHGNVQFPYAKIFRLIEGITFANEILLAPISKISREILDSVNLPFELTPNDWFNIVDLEITEARKPEGDRRGRHSRPGCEKWPSKADLETCFPMRSDNYILGADWIGKVHYELSIHANLFDFGKLEVNEFLKKFDFFVYYHSSGWRESFGRVITEAIAGGKLVIGQEYLSKTFESGGIFCDVSRLNEKIASVLDTQDEFVERVSAAQLSLKYYNRKSFENIWFEKILS